MERRKFEIPQMNNEEIAKWYATIKPIVDENDKARYLRNLSDEELIKIAYTWLNEPSDYGEYVDYSKLSALADVKMLHGWGYYGLFKPSVGEVIRQIPNEYLEKVVAFEILEAPISMNGIFNEELNAGFHVSVVRLYQAKDANNKAAEPVENYPTADSVLPIGMTEEEFNSFKELHDIE